MSALADCHRRRCRTRTHRCGHCKALKPDFAKASTELDSMFDGKDTKVVVSAVDCTKETEVCKKFDVQGYPTLYYFDDADDDGSKYEEGRTKKDLVSYMAKVTPHSLPRVRGPDTARCLRSCLFDRLPVSRAHGMCRKWIRSGCRRHLRHSSTRRCGRTRTTAM